MVELATMGSWHQAQAERPLLPPDLSALISSSPAWEPLAWPDRGELASSSLTSPHPPTSLSRPGMGGQKEGREDKGLAQTLALSIQA